MQDGYRDGMCGSDERNVKFCSTDFWQEEIIPVDQ